MGAASCQTASFRLPGNTHARIIHPNIRQRRCRYEAKIKPNAVCPLAGGAGRTGAGIERPAAGPAPGSGAGLCGGAEALRRQPTARAVPTVCGVRPAGAAGSGAGVAAAAFDAAVRDPQPTGLGGAGVGLVWWIRGVRPTDCSIAQNGGTAPAGCRAPAAVGLLFRPRLCGWLHWGAVVWQRGAGAAAVWLAAGSQPCCRSLPGAIFAKAGIASWAGEQSTKERDLPTGHQQCGAKQPDGVRLRGVLPCGGQCVGAGNA